MKFVIKVKGGIVDYNGEPYREIIDKEVVRTITEVKRVKKRFLKNYPEYVIEVKEFFNGTWRVVAL
ncbi:hypothetical protein [Cetobacterium sp.]|uniref:hypothetical protein n=1 Tax=Cetobacterium sp. TaxID=2071632 RepID=UPI003EE53E61